MPSIVTPAEDTSERRLEFWRDVVSQSFVPLEYTVSGWLREQRLARCRRDLGDPALRHLSVGAIGGRWGFPDPAHFSHAFKAAYGMSPRDVRAGGAPHPREAGRG